MTYQTIPCPAHDAEADISDAWNDVVNAGKDCVYECCDALYTAECHRAEPDVGEAGGWEYHLVGLRLRSWPGGMSRYVSRETAISIFGAEWVADDEASTAERRERDD
jgi:hypothetical protein